jgi:hypothetical protein
MPFQGQIQARNLFGYRGLLILPRPANVTAPPLQVPQKVSPRAPGDGLMIGLYAENKFEEAPVIQARGSGNALFFRLNSR